MPITLYACAWGSDKVREHAIAPSRGDAHMHALPEWVITLAHGSTRCAGRRREPRPSQSPWQVGPNVECLLQREERNHFRR